MRFLRVGPCGRETMLEFAEFQQNALKLTDQLKRRSIPSLGCFCFFSVILPNSAA
ncbi:TPA: lpg1752 family Dot/Icm T4SS effector, partial [Legionella pneumophila]